MRKMMKTKTLKILLYTEKYASELNTLEEKLTEQSFCFIRKLIYCRMGDVNKSH